MSQATDSAGPPAAPPGNPDLDQRSDRRVSLLLRAGKLVSPDGEFLCIVRDASAGGIKARLLHGLPGSGTFDLELANGEVYPLQLVWQAAGHAGFRFLDRPIDVHGLVDEPSSFPKRGLRLRLTMPVSVTEAGEERPAVLRDISQHGAQIEIEPGLAVGQRIALRGSGLPAMQATVRWRRRGAHGLVFQRGFRLDELAELVGRLRDGESGKSPGNRAAR
ncbi:MAG: PilZ domain-containing protein [Sphingomonadaceae bacterium]|nr:PilZ domain-containing protein [Sphingomonadaceae bacterium]